MHRLVLMLLPALVAGCSSTWSARDEDGDEKALVDGDCSEAPGEGGAITPGGAEVWYDGVDGNCDGGSDFDKDGDGVDSAEFGGLDCWDDPEVTPADFQALNGLPALDAASVHPDADDIPYDGIDANCDGASDFDADGDGYDTANEDYRQRDGSIGDDCYDDLADPYPESGAGDYDLLPADVNVAAAEAWYDGTDQDCDGWSDYDQDRDGYNVDAECDDTNDAIYPNPDIPEDWTNNVDENCDGNIHDKDEDGFVDAAWGGDDCWDDYEVVPTGFSALNGFRQPLSTEVRPDALDQPYDGVDADCAGDDDFDFDDDGVTTDSWPNRFGVTGTDCDDGDGDTYPGASDTWYDGTDSDCAGDSDYDADRDGYDATGRISTGTDCDDTEPAVRPGVNEDCSTADDDNCDGSLDLQNAANCDTFYLDADGDTYGATSNQCWCEPQTATNYDATRSNDCDDAAAGSNPAATEICDGADTDEDCDGLSDNNDSTAASSGKTSFFHDDDRDGYGDTSHAGASYCDNPTTSSQVWVTDHTDCDDNSPTDYPGATETVANGDDEDCDGVDSCYQDTDNDGYGTTTVVDGSTLDCTTGTGANNDDDCNDASSSIYLGATETVADGVDQDCDNVDSCYTDADNDNYGTTVVVDGSTLNCTTGTGAPVSTDCNDGRASAYPGAPEILADGIDQDCDSVDSCYQDADNDNYGTAVIVDGSTLDCTSGTGAPNDDDCDDVRSTAYPGATETPADSIDQDCDSVDSCYTDSDGDNFGTTVVIDGSSLNCTTGTGAPNALDCNDASTSIYYGATETVADGVDQDCDNVDSCYTDADGDNYGTTVVVDGSTLSCATGTGAANDDDCNDGSTSIYLGATETVADGVDQDCDGVDSCYQDSDGDNYGTSTVVDGSTLSCDTGTGSANDEDCNDALSSIYLGASETVADGVDQDCDGVDSCYQDVDGDNYGTTTVVDGSTLSCASGTGAANDDDCNDGSTSIYLGAAETTADGIDQDCDGVDTCYTDADGDNYGIATTSDGSSLSCDTGSGSTNTTDCDDGNSGIRPGAADPTDGDLVDDDCDGLYDEDDIAEGDVVFTEFFVGSTGSYDYVEIYNNSGFDLDLSGWTLTACTDTDTEEALPYDCAATGNANDTSNSYTIADLVILDGDYAVLCASTSRFNASQCDLQWSFASISDIASSNGGFYLTLSGDPIDDVVFWQSDTSDDWPSSLAYSVQFSSDVLDPFAFTTNDDWTSDGTTADQWCLTTSGADWTSSTTIDYYGTPGAANEDCTP